MFVISLVGSSSEINSGGTGEDKGTGEFADRVSSGTLDFQIPF